MKKISISVFILVLLSANYLSITNARFHESFYDLISFLPYDPFLKNSLINKEKSTKSLLHTVSNRIIKRTVKNVVTKEESMPFLGPVMILVVRKEIKDGCDTVHDMQEINKAFGVENIEYNDFSVCGIKLQTLD